MKFENTEVYNFDGAIRGARNPMNSWDKSDGKWVNGEYLIGHMDMDLLRRLISAGSSDRKFLRQIMVCVDITAPMYWWSEFDTYKISTVANSTSKMHKLASTPITIDCFEHNNGFDSVNNTGDSLMAASMWNRVIDDCEKLRLRYLDTKDKRYWKTLIQLLPESWLQKRTWTANYEVIRNMVNQRKNHKLNEWSGCDDPTKPNFIAWAKSLPYADDLIFGLIH